MPSVLDLPRHKHLGHGRVEGEEAGPVVVEDPDDARPPRGAVFQPSHVAVARRLLEVHLEELRVLPLVVVNHRDLDLLGERALGPEPQHALAPHVPRIPDVRRLGLGRPVLGTPRHRHLAVRAPARHDSQPDPAFTLEHLDLAPREPEDHGLVDAGEAGRLQEALPARRSGTARRPDRPSCEAPVGRPGQRCRQRGRPSAVQRGQGHLPSLGVGGRRLGV
mmetsp:Transcript_61916/g.164639  ORF Transcript_61916/g.164639 Transcript_61916/m.164639 type:complete len:220 (-) Transcript_61916:857-1516(-)